MATISTVTDTTMFQIKKWLGVNENPDGDTRIKLGEAAEMRNWRITKNGSLQIRPGTEKVRKFGSLVNDEWHGVPVHGMWYGFVGNGYHWLAAAGSKLYEILRNTIITNRSDLHFDEYDINEIGTVSASNHVEFFAFQGFLYILDGVSYQKWDGIASSISSVTGYVPTIMTGCDCATGAGTMAEGANLLTLQRRVLYTVKDSEGTGGSLNIKLQETVSDTSSARITNLTTGTDYANVTWSNNTATISGTIPHGPNVISVTYTSGSSAASEVTSMRFAEFFNGANDNRVFLYGNGTNTCIYSGIESSGQPSAEYFPALNQIQVGEANTPITGMIRHFARLVCYKSNATYSIAYDTLTLQDGNVVAGFYITPSNREIGNAPLGQVRLISNNPVSFHNGNAYLWRSNSSSGSISYDERNATIISDRIENSLKAMNLSEIKTFDHNYDQEFYIFAGSDMIVYNYGFNVWYAYSNLRVNSVVEIDHVLYFGMADGSVRRFTRNVHGDYHKIPSWAKWDGEAWYIPIYDHYPTITGLTNSDYYKWDFEHWYEWDGSDWTPVQDSSGLHLPKMLQDSFGDQDHPDGIQQKTRCYFLSKEEHDPTILPREQFCYINLGIPYYNKAMDADKKMVPDAEKYITHFEIIMDDGVDEIDAYWRSGAMAFDRDWKRKYSMRLWVSIMPENNSRITVTAMSDKRGEYPIKELIFGTMGFGNINFSDFSFGNLRIVQVKRVKLKVKKYAFYRLIFESVSKEYTATIVSTDIQVRYASNVK